MPGPLKNLRVAFNFGGGSMLVLVGIRSALFEREWLTRTAVPE